MPLWKYTLNVKDLWDTPEDSRTDENVPEIAREITRRIRKSPFWDSSDNTLVDVTLLIDSSRTLSAFNEAWNRFYDWADDNRVWVKTF